MASFGELLGAEIRSVRESKSWTQLALAHRAYDPESAEAAERRIREYERGKVKRPQAKVYISICDALGIDHRRIAELKHIAGDKRAVNRAEIEELRLEKGSLEQALKEVKSLSILQLETLAVLFDLRAPPDRSEKALVALLSKKAEDYRALQVEIDSIDTSLRNLSKLKTAASEAIRVGDLEEVESLLRGVQKAELGEFSKTTELRSKNYLLRGNVSAASRVLNACANSYGTIGPSEPYRVRCDFFLILFEHGLKYGADELLQSAHFLLENLDAWVEQDSPTVWTNTHHSAARALGEYGRRVGGTTGQEYLQRAINFAKMGSQSKFGSKDSKQIAKSKGNLAVYHLYLWDLQSDKNDRDIEANVKLLEEALSLFQSANESEDAWKAEMNLGYSLYLWCLYSEIEGSEERIAKSVKHLTSASLLIVREKNSWLWGVAHNNLGLALIRQSMVADTQDVNQILRDSLKAFETAKLENTRAENYVEWAQTENNIGWALSLLGDHSKGKEKLIHFKDAIDVFDGLASEELLERFPTQWTMTKRNLALVLLDLAECIEVPERIGHLRSAEFHLMEVDEKIGDDTDFQNIEENRVTLAKIREKIEIEQNDG